MCRRLSWIVCGLLCWLGIGLVSGPKTAVAQSGCALHINEVMYHPAPGTDAAARAEWVELRVVTSPAIDTTFFITDQDAAAVGDFEMTFVVPAGTAVGTYVLIHNDGDPANNGQSGSQGIYNTLSFFMGNGAVKLNNDGDEIVLYQGGATDGVPCDYMEYETPNSPRPGGFNWNTACPNPNAVDVGFSISLDPDGEFSNSSCDWARSGEHSPNNPDLPLTYAPSSKGWSNTTTPTAVSLATFTAKPASHQLSLLATLLVGMFTLFSWKYQRRAS